jgi:hydroxymethylglutaryl-CoA synthase
VVVEALGIGPEVHVADFEFACKAGTEAMSVALAMVESGRTEYAIGIGADTSQGAPNDALEFSASAGGAAFVFGKDDLLADVLDSYSYTSDTPDFWRREGEFYPRHGGRFTGEPAYFHHVMSATQGMLDRSGFEPKDFKYVVFHMPNGKFPLSAAKRLGFRQEQMETGWIVNLRGTHIPARRPRVSLRSWMWRTRMTLSSSHPSALAREATLSCSGPQISFRNEGTWRRRSGRCWTTPGAT